MPQQFAVNLQYRLGLLLARVTARHKEVAVRIALGPSRWRIICQLLTESIILSALSGLLGLVFAYAGIRLLVALTPPDVPRLHEMIESLPDCARLMLPLLPLMRARRLSQLGGNTKLFQLIDHYCDKGWVKNFC